MAQYLLYLLAGDAGLAQSYAAGAAQIVPAAKVSAMVLDPAHAPVPGIDRERLQGVVPVKQVMVGRSLGRLKFTHDQWVHGNRSIFIHLRTVGPDDAGIKIEPLPFRYAYLVNGNAGTESQQDGTIEINLFPFADQDCILEDLVHLGVGQEMRHDRRRPHLIAAIESGVMVHDAAFH